MVGAGSTVDGLYLGVIRLSLGKLLVNLLQVRGQTD